MKGNGGSSCKGFRETNKTKARGDSKYSIGMVLISFNTCTSGNVGIDPGRLPSDPHIPHSGMEYCD